jgi:hypothetical protein
MANTLLTIAMITNEALFVLRNNLTAAKRVNRQYDDKFGVDGAKIGTSLNIRKPPQFTVTSGPGLAVQDITESQVALVLSNQEHVDFTFTTADLLLSIDMFAERILEPAIAALANRIDYDVLQNYKNIFNLVGTPGTTPNTFLTYANAGAKLSNSAAPVDGRRSILINPTFEATIVDALKGLFQSATQIKEQYEKGQMGLAIGFEWFMDQNTPTHTIGALGGTPAVNGASQTGSSLVTNGWTAAVGPRLNYGDVIQIAGVYSVNPQSKQSTGVLQDFTVTAPVSSDVSGNATLGISPPITVTGPSQTVTASPAAGALISVFGTAAAGQATLGGSNSPQGLAIHRDCITLATADLPLPRGVHAAYRMADTDLGISLRVVQAYDINTDKMPCRIDVLYGTTTLRGELGCRIAG